MPLGLTMASREVLDPDVRDVGQGEVDERVDRGGVVRVRTEAAGGVR